MKTITIELDDNAYAEAVEGVAKENGYEARVERDKDGNPKKTKDEYFHEKIAEFIGKSILQANRSVIMEKAVQKERNRIDKFHIKSK
jgi:hypothetical protein